MKDPWKRKWPASLSLLLSLCFPSPAAPAGQEEQNSSASLVGFVIDSRTRQAISGACVDLVRGRVAAGFSTRSQEPSVSAVTDREGHFRFDSIEPGVHTLMVSKRGHVPSPFHTLKLEPGTTMTRDVEMDSMAKISGRVVNQAAQAVEGARVAAVVSLMPRSADLDRFLGERGALGLTTTSEAQGKFELFVPHGGEVTLVAEAAGYASNRVGPLQVDVGRGREVVVRLPSGLEARGRVVEEGGAPLSRATIEARRSEPGISGLGFEAMGQRAQSSDDGRFVLRGLERGTHVLKVRHEGHATRTVHEVEIQAATSQIPTIVLRREAEIHGQVTDAAGQFIAGARVSGFAREEDIQVQAVSGDDGEFVLGGFPPGAGVFVWAEAEGYNRADKAVTAPDSSVVLTLCAEGRLRGRVEDFETREPLKEFRIWVAGSPEERVFRSDDGSFEWSGLPLGQWLLVAQAPGYQKAELHGVEIHAGDRGEDVVFRLRRGVEVAGRVLDKETGKALTGAMVTYHDTSEPERPGWLRFNRNAQSTDVDGRFDFDGVPPVKVTILAQFPLYAEARKTVMAGEEGFVEIGLNKGGASLSGRVVASDGVTAVPGAQVSLEDQNSRIGHGTAADGTGAFSFDRLNPGRYRLVALSDFGQTQSQDIVLQENGRLGDLLLSITPGTTLRGMVRGILPHEGRIVNLNAHGRGGFTAFVSTDVEGIYAIHGVPAGVVQVMASTSAFRSVSKSIEVPEGVPELAFDINFPLAARLSGRVTRAGVPVRRAGVSAVPVDPQLASGSGETSPDGMYAIDGLSDGNYVVRVSGKAPASVRISGDTTLDIQLSAQFVSGRVVEAGSGEALAGASVRLQDNVRAGALMTSATDGMGRFSLEGIESGNYQIVVYKRGFKVHAETVSVPSSPLELSLTRTEGIVIRVRDGISGLGLQTVSVNVFSGPARLNMDVALDEAGRGELPQLPPGRYNLIVSAWGFASTPVIGWTVPSSPLDLVLTPGGRLEIQVGSAHLGLRASLIGANGIPARPASDPWFTLLQPTVFPHLAPGEYTLSVRFPTTVKTYRTTISEGRTTVLRAE